MKQSAGYRAGVAALTVAVGVGMTTVLGATMLNTSPTSVSAPEEILSAPEFAGELQIMPGDFYQIDNLDAALAAAPGTLLKSEVIADAPDGILAQRFLYTSQTATGTPQVVSGMYATRKGPEPGPNGRPLVAVSHGTTGNAPGCGISIAPFTPGSPGFGTWDMVLSGLVGSGFAVVATDYANLAVPGVPDYITMQGEGSDVLNSIRAAFALDRTGIDRSQVALLGHSQGGHSALSAAYIADEYAPEISLKGTVAIAPALFPPAPLLKSFLTLAPDEDAAAFLAFVSLIVNSWAANYPDQISVADVFTPAGVAAAEVGQTGCLRDSIAAFKGPKKDFLKMDLPDSILELSQQNFPIYTKYNEPVLIQQGLKDTTVVPGVNIAAARTFCQLGSQVNLQTFPEDVHSSVLFTGESEAISWLQDRFNDAPVRSDCGGM